MARRYEFYVRVAETISHEWAQRTSEMSFLPREHKIHIFEPTCNVLFIIWRPDVTEIADFYFLVFEKSSKFYKSPFVFTENTKHPCPGYRNTNWIPIKQNTWNTCQLNIVRRKNWKHHWLWLESDAAMSWRPIVFNCFCFLLYNILHFVKFLAKNSL